MLCLRCVCVCVCIGSCPCSTPAGCMLVSGCGSLGPAPPCWLPRALGKKGGGGGGCSSGGHTWWKPSAQGKESSPWICPGVVPNLQRWLRQSPAALHLLFEVLKGLDGFVLLAALGLSYTPSHSLRPVSSQPGGWRGLTIACLFCPPSSPLPSRVSAPALLVLSPVLGQAEEHGRTGSRPWALGPNTPCSHLRTSLSPRVDNGSAVAFSAAAGMLSVRAA